MMRPFTRDDFDVVDVALLLIAFVPVFLAGVVAGVLLSRRAMEREASRLMELMEEWHRQPAAPGRTVTTGATFIPRDPPLN